MGQQTVKVITVDPYHAVYGQLVPQIAQKIILALEDMPDIQAFVPDFMARLWRRDPTVILMTAIASSGDVKGYCAGLMEGPFLVIVQPRLDEPTDNDAVAEMVEAVEGWGKAAGATHATLMTKKLSDSRWTKKYGFRPSRHILIKEL